MVALVLKPGERRIKRTISMCQAFGQRSIRAITKLNCFCTFSIFVLFQVCIFSIFCQGGNYPALSQFRFELKLIACKLLTLGSWSLIPRITPSLASGYPRDKVSFLTLVSATPVSFLTLLSRKETKFCTPRPFYFYPFSVIYKNIALGMFFTLRVFFIKVASTLPYGVFFIKSFAPFRPRTNKIRPWAL